MAERGIEIGLVPRLQVAVAQDVGRPEPEVDLQGGGKIRDGQRRLLVTQRIVEPVEVAGAREDRPVDGAPEADDAGQRRAEQLAFEYPGQYGGGFLQVTGAGGRARPLT